MSRLIPDDRSDEFAWICSLGHWNRHEENFCRECREPKPEDVEVLKDLLQRIHDEHPRSNDD